jgi:hypothetical protein
MTTDNLTDTQYTQIWEDTDQPHLGAIPLPNGGHTDNTKAIVECHYHTQVEVSVVWAPHHEYKKMKSIDTRNVCLPDFTPQWITSNDELKEGKWGSETVVYRGTSSVLERDLKDVANELRMINSSLDIDLPVTEQHRRNSLVYAIRKIIIRGPFAFLNNREDRTTYIVDVILFVLIIYHLSLLADGDFPFAIVAYNSCLV